jgi:hypothetical protein
VTLVLGPAEGTARPCHKCCDHAGGGNVLVTQPASDTIATALTGAVVARADPFHDAVAGYDFDLYQDFEVVFNDPTVHGARLLMEGRILGVLRNPAVCVGSPCNAAEISTPGHAAVHCGPQQFLALTVPGRSAACGEELSVYGREGPVSVPIVPGKYSLHEVFGIRAVHDHRSLLCKGTSAEFAPEPALDARWISTCEPFHGVNKKNFGFQVILKVVPDNSCVVPAPREPAAGPPRGAPAEGQGIQKDRHP